MSLHFERMEADFLRSLSEAIRAMKDPRLTSMTSVVRTELTKDLKFAKAYISVFNDDQAEREEIISVLGKASKMLSHEINSKMKMRRVPSIQFVLDDSIAYSAHINKLLNKINSERPNQEDDNAEGQEE